MRLKPEEFDRFADRIRSLSGEKEVNEAQIRLENLLFERELLERKEEEYLRGVVSSKSPDPKQAEKDILPWRNQRWELSRALVAEYENLRKRLGIGHVRTIPDSRNVGLATLVARLGLNDLVGCVAVERPSGLQFLHSWNSDNSATLVGLGVDLGGGGITSLHYQIDRYGPAFLTLEATWGFIVPSADLCGFEVSCSMTVEGFVDPKATRTVTIDPNVHVRQFRSNLPLDQVLAGPDPLLSNIWGRISAEGVELSEPGYVDGIYGLHAIPTIQSEVRCAYAYPTHTARVPVVAGDRILVSSQLILAMDAYTYVLLGDPRAQPTTPLLYGVRFSQPTVTFYTDA